MSKVGGMALVLTLKPGIEIVLHTSDGDITVQFDEVSAGGNVPVRIDAPRSVAIERRDLLADV
jgi:sRNA-binding carbon storage regulator CsrA